MKWSTEATEQARALLTEFAADKAALRSIDRQEAARFERRGMPKPEDI